MPSSYQGYDIVKFDRAAVATLAQHVTELEEAHMREYAIPAQLQSGGRVLYNQSGRGMDWRVKYKRRSFQANTGANTRNFTPKNVVKLAALSDRGYYIDDSISSLEILQNRGKEAIGNLMSEMVNGMVEDLNQGLATQYFIDGNDADNLDFWCGFMTMFPTNGTLNYSSGAQRAANQDDYVAYPYGTYADLSTELGAYGGSNESGRIWPEGDSDPEYDFWSPIIVIGDSNRFSGTTHNWRNQCVEAMRFGITHSAKVGGKSQRPTTIVLDRSMYNDLKNKAAELEEIQVEDQNSLRALGFRDVIQIDGVEVTYDNAIPAHNGFGFAYPNITMRNLYGEMLHREGPQYMIKEQAHVAVVSTLGNLKFKSPRNFFRIVDSYANL